MAEEVGKKMEVIGDGTKTEFDIDHGLKGPVLVQVFEAGGEKVEVDVVQKQPSRVTIRVSKAPEPQGLWVLMVG